MGFVAIGNGIEKLGSEWESSEVQNGIEVKLRIGMKLSASVSLFTSLRRH